MLGIGQRLRSAREGRGLSLEEIEAVTRIRRRYLEALETEAFDQLPAAAYAQAFLRAYATYLELPAEDLQEIYPRLRAGPAMAHGSSIDVRLTPATPQSRGRRIIAAIAAIVGIVAVLLGYMLYDQLRQFASTLPPSSPEQVPSGTRSSATPSSVPLAPTGALPSSSAEAPPSAQPEGTQPQGTELQAAQQAVPGGPAQPPSASSPPASAPAQQMLLAGPIQVVVDAADRSWIRAIADGVNVFEGFVRMGDRQVWQAQRELAITVGNAGAVTLSVNGQSLGRLGTPGQVVVRTFTTRAPVP